MKIDHYGHTVDRHRQPPRRPSSFSLLAKMSDPIATISPYDKPRVYDGCDQVPGRILYPSLRGGGGGGCGGGSGSGGMHRTTTTMTGTANTRIHSASSS